MARRSRGDDTGGLILVAILAVAYFLFQLLIVVLRVVATGLSYLGILMLSVLFFHSRDAFQEWLKNKDRNLPLSSGFNPIPFFHDLVDHLADVENAKRQLPIVQGKYQQATQKLGTIRQGIENIRAEAKAEDVERNDDWYDLRTRKGKELTERRKYLEQKEREFKETVSGLKVEIARLSNRIRTGFDPDFSKLADWRTPYDQGVTLASSANAARDAMLVYVISFVTSLFLPNFFHFNPTPLFIGVIPAFQWFYLPSALATVLSLAAFHVRQKHYEGSLVGVLEPDYFKQWKGIQEYLSNLRESDPQFRAWQAQHRPRQEQKSGDQSSNAGPGSAGSSGSMGLWYQVLGVSENASAEEIKSAKRHKLQKFHPDKVASQDPKLRAFAERITMAINRAYQEAERLGKV